MKTKTALGIIVATLALSACENEKVNVAVPSTKPTCARSVDDIKGYLKQKQPTFAQSSLDLGYKMQIEGYNDYPVKIMPVLEGKGYQMVVGDCQTEVGSCVEVGVPIKEYEQMAGVAWVKTKPVKDKFVDSD